MVEKLHMYTLVNELTVTGTAALDHSHTLPTVIIIHNHPNHLQH